MDWQELSSEVLTYFESIKDGGPTLLYLLDICSLGGEWDIYFTRDMSELDYEYDLEDMIAEGNAYDEDGGEFDMSKPYYYYDEDLNIISTSNPDIFCVNGLLRLSVVEDIYDLWKELYAGDTESDALTYEDREFMEYLPKYVKDLFFEYYCDSEGA